MPTTHDQQTINGFYEEARGYLAPLAECISQLHARPADPDILSEIHRFAHLIRGASAVVGLPRLTELTGDLESFVENILCGQFAWDPDHLATIEEAATVIQLQLERPHQPATPAPIHAPQSIDPEILSGFLLEAEEILAATATDLHSFPQSLPAVRRAVHTLKGASAMVGLTRFSSLAHRLEDALDNYAPDLLPLIHPTLDLLTDLIAAGGTNADLEARIPTLLEQYNALLGTAPTPTALPEQGTIDDSPEAARTVRVPLDRVDELISLVTELFLHRFSFERSLTRYGHEVSELALSLRRLQTLSTSFERDNVLVEAPTSQNTNPEFDPLEFDRYSRLYTHSRDLTEATADVGAAQAQFHSLSSEFDAFLNRERRLTSQLQDRLLRFRMVPLSTLAARLHRTVRVAAEQSGKQAELHLNGAHTELDKTMLEALSGPLEHLLRNAVAHGIESPEDRVRAGKSPTGQIRIAAALSGSQIVLHIEDDGSGISLDRIRERAQVPSDATPEQLYSLLFRPGFTTNTEVNELSGRGLGLDVVRTTVESFKGTLALESTPGEGTQFTLRLPLTLAIRRVLIVESEGHRFALPLASVSQVARLDSTQIDSSTPTPTARFQNQRLPLHHLSQVLQLANQQEPEPVPATAPTPTLHLQEGDLQFALTVDRIHEAREVVIKPLSPLLGHAPHLSGATLLGESIIPILNPAALSSPLAFRAGAPPPAPTLSIHTTPQRHTYDILIVDDSLSVRRVLAALLTRQGWLPTQAKDGLEALDILRKAPRLPDLILLDVEMPRMDGFELTSILRSTSHFRHVPIVMLTSRSGDKHRTKAFSAGVSDYLVKPYQDDHLLSTIRSNIKRTRALLAS